MSTDRQPWFIERNQVCVPSRFFDDYCQRDMPTPKVQRMQGVSYWLAIDDPALGDLFDDAEFYAEPYSVTSLDIDPLLRRSAVTTRNRIATARKWMANH